MKNADANDIPYWKFLVDETKQFFNGRAQELERMCINPLIEMFVFGSISLQLTRKSYSDSKVVPSMQIYVNEKEDPLR